VPRHRKPIPSYLPHKQSGRARAVWTDCIGIRTVQELLGHKDVRTTMIDTHVLSRGPAGATSPLDRRGV
jgi:hypothetical protein